MTLSLASKILFNDFCTVLDRISKSPTREQKYAYLTSFIAQCRDHGKKIKSRYEDADVSFLPILKLLLPQHVRDRGSYGMQEFTLAKLYARVLCLGKNSPDERELLHYKSPSAAHDAGDFAEVAFRVLQGRILARKSSMTVEQINAILDKIAENNANNESKELQFCELIQELTAVEQKWFIRLVLKDLKVGLSYKTILNAYHPDATDLFDKTMSLRNICDKLTNPKIRVTFGIELFSSFKPMLLQRCNIEDTEKFFVQNKTYVLQPKHDGERFQIHFKDGEFKYFTRNGYDFTHAYGESASSDNLLSCKIAKLLDSACQSIILDGEMMGWHKEKERFGSKGMSFDVKKMTPTSSHQPCFIAFDIILYNDELLINRPVTERLKVLEKAFVDEEGVMIKSESKTVSSSAELLAEFNKSIDTHGEGIVLKTSDSIYKVGIRDGSGCYKIKAEYSPDLVEDLDLLIIGGYYGEGRFRGRVNSFLVGVANPSNDPAKFCVKFHAVCSVRSGISIEKLEDLLQKLQPYWAKKCPPDVVGPKKGPPDLWIDPQNSIVLQLRASEMVRSSVYPTDYSLRFPRIIAVRDPSEKSWSDCCTIKELHSLIKNPGVIQKLSKRNASTSDINVDDKSKSPKKMKQNTRCVADHFLTTTVNVVRISHLLDGKEICVLNGNEQMSKHDAEKLVMEHGGNVVANATATTFCVIVGNIETVKAKNAIQSGKYDIVTIDWLLHVTNPNNLAGLQSWLPWELVSMSESTRMKISAKFDGTFDSYTEDADLESLKRSLDKAESMVANIKLTSEQYQLIDKELFRCNVSPFSIFRGYVGYFTSGNSPRTSMFRFMEGLVSEDLGTNVTHVFLNKRNSPSVDIYKRVRDTNPDINVVDEHWIVDCFEKGELLPETELSYSTPEYE